MSAAAPPDLDRLVALLVDRALQGLAEREQAELDALLAAFPDLDAAALEETAAQIDVALAPEPRPLTPGLRRGLVGDLAGGAERVPAAEPAPRPASEAAPPPPELPDEPTPRPAPLPEPPPARAPGEDLRRPGPRSWLLVAAGFAAGAGVGALAMAILGT